MEYLVNKTLNTLIVKNLSSVQEISYTLSFSNICCDSSITNIDTGTIPFSESNINISQVELPFQTDGKFTLTLVSGNETIVVNIYREIEVLREMNNKIVELICKKANCINCTETKDCIEKDILSFFIYKFGTLRINNNGTATDFSKFINFIRDFFSENYCLFKISFVEVINNRKYFDTEVDEETRVRLIIALFLSFYFFDLYSGNYLETEVKDLYQYTKLKSCTLYFGYDITFLEQKYTNSDSGSNNQEETEGNYITIL